MKKIQEKLIQNFLSDVVEGENCNKVSLITSIDASKLVNYLNKKNLKQVSIQPAIKHGLNIQSDLYIVLNDVNLPVSDLGIIKNLLSQKIIVIKSESKEAIDNSELLKLGFNKEFEDKKDGLSFFAYNLKTYNNKRDWNNPKGWANPENFDKFRW